MPDPWIAACELEPIHMPGATQSWGALLIVGEADQIVRHASANLGDFIELSASEAIGRSLSAVMDPELVALLTAAGGAAAPGGVAAIVPPTGTGRAMAISSHRLNGSLTIEIETLPDTDGEAAAGSWSDARVVVEALRGARDLDMLFAVAAVEMRRITGFDRAMVYRFDATGHGDVVAEDRAADMEPFLGLHYPASDIPRQARRLYLRQRVRIIEDSRAAAVKMLRASDAAGPPDLSLAAMRAASPIHLGYMRNMGVRASIAVSLIVDGALWGMLVCHHRGPRRLAPGKRAFADLIGQVASLMIGTLGDTALRNEAAQASEAVAALAARLAVSRSGAGGLAAALEANAPALLSLCGAPGAIVRLAGRTLLLGAAPGHDDACRLLDALMAAAPDAGEAFPVTESGTLLQAAASGMPLHAAASGTTQANSIRQAASGALLLKLMHAPGDCIVWLRPEQARTVRWGGNPDHRVEIDPDTGALSPRRSFALWQQVVRGQSTPWTAAQIAAAHGLRREIDQIMVRCAEAELARLRQHDALTGLPNRRLLRERLETWAHERPSSCLLVVEIDRFKSINEAVGELLGDGVLIEAGNRIERVAAAPGVMVARTGSFAFGVFCQNMSSSGAATLADALRAAMAEPFEIGGKPIRMTASVGIAPVNSGTADRSADELLARADVALQAAKMRGGNRALEFSSRLRAGAGKLMEIEQELRALLGGDNARAGAFRLTYQPCVALGQSDNAHATGPCRPILRGFEALLRWDHPRLGSIPPGDFIGIAEDCGLIEAVGDWVLRESIAQLAAWRGLAGGLPHEVWRVAVNVSPHQLARPEFAQEVMALLAAHDLPPHCLTIEVTEGVFADERAAGVVADMRRAGLKIAVDDFGIGFSSLSYLRRLPADELKLDRSFLQRSDGGPLHEDLLGALVQLARAVGLSVLAEGVETEEHLAAVTAAGCDAAQGWLFARALPPEEAAEWIAGASAIAAGDQTRSRMPFSFRDIVEAANEGVMVMDASPSGRGPAIVYINPAFSRITGWKLTDLLGKSPAVLQGPKTDAAALAEMMAHLRDGRPAQTRVMHYARSGMAYWCEIRSSPLRDQHGRITHFVAIERDVTHEMRRLDDLEALVERDPLTSIANRRGLDRFATSLPDTAGLPLCVAYIDIDGFKSINDSFGHPAGDALLMGVADLLCENMRRVDFVGRLGGDEFVVCMPSIMPSDAYSVAERLQRSIANHAFETPAGPLRTDCSVGVAVMRPSDAGLSEVIARADAALYRAKDAGRGRVVMAEEVSIRGTP